MNSEDRYRRLRDALLQCIDRAMELEGIPECPCEELREKLTKSRFHLVVVGQFKRGKTTFINAFLGADVLPTAVVPLTSIVTVIEYGEEPSATVYYNDGRVEEIGLDRLAEFVTEKGNPKNQKDVAEVVLRYPSQYLKDGVRLIDTPGVGSVYRHNTDVAYEYLPRSDAALFLLSVDQPLSEAEVAFLKDVREYSYRIFFLQNKADYLNEEDLMESLQFVRDTLSRDVGFEAPEVYPVSAKLALMGKTSKNPEALLKSNIPQFEERLKRFLLEEKGLILLKSVTDNLLRVVSEGILRMEIQLRALMEPLQQIEEKLRAYEEKERQIEVEKRDFEILLEGETKRIISEILDPDLSAAKAELTERLLPEFDRFYQKNRHLSAGKLRKALEEFISSEVREYYSIFRRNEDTKISIAFEKVADRFIRKINLLVDELLKYSSELFNLEFRSFSAEALWSRESGFYFKFKDEPLMVEMLGEALTSLLPKFISNAIVKRSMKNYMLEMIERQAGRIRWDFVERLQKSRLEFRWQMLQRIEETSKGIKDAVSSALRVRTESTEEMEASRQQVEQNLQRLHELKREVEEIKNALEGS